MKGDVAKWERIRRLRAGELKRLFHYRYRTPVLPDDQAGRGDLWLLMLNASLATHEPELKMHSVIDLWAPWMPEWERKDYVKLLWGLDFYQRIQSGRKIGELLYLRNEERMALNLTQFKPIDATDAELEEQRKARRRERRRAKRTANGVKPREVYLAKMAAKPKPWIAADMSRPTYYRKVRRGVVPAILGKAVPYLVPPSQAESQFGRQEGVTVEKPTLEATNTERNASCSQGRVTDLVSSEERKWTKPTILSDELLLRRAG